MDKARRMRRWAQLGVMPTMVAVCAMHAAGAPMALAAALGLAAWWALGAICVRFARPCWAVGQRRLWQPRGEIWRTAVRAALIAAVAAGISEALYGELMRVAPVLRFAQAMGCVAAGQALGYRKSAVRAASIEDIQENALMTP